MADLYIYATLYNNIDRIEASIASIQLMNPKKIFVVDNFSNDGSYEKLKAQPNVMIIRKRCRRGAGRNAALNLLLEVAEPEDLVLTVDFDVIYKQPFIDWIAEKSKTIQHMELYPDMGFFSRASTNKNLEWPPLNAMEDIERTADAIHLGIKTYVMEIRDATFWSYYTDNDWFIKGKREARYESNPISKYRRYFIHLVDMARGSGASSFKSFFNREPNHSLFNFVGFWCAYAVASLLGEYSYQQGIDNYEYIKEHGISIKGFD